jgi:hypothetical protein
MPDLQAAILAAKQRGLETKEASTSEETKLATQAHAEAVAKAKEWLIQAIPAAVEAHFANGKTSVEPVVFSFSPTEHYPLVVVEAAESMDEVLHAKATQEIHSLADTAEGKSVFGLNYVLSLRLVLTDFS